MAGGAERGGLCGQGCIIMHEHGEEKQAVDEHFDLMASHLAEVVEAQMTQGYFVCRAKALRAREGLTFDWTWPSRLCRLQG